MNIRERKGEYNPSIKSRKHYVPYKKLEEIAFSVDKTLRGYDFISCGYLRQVNGSFFLKIKESDKGIIYKVGGECAKYNCKCIRELHPPNYESDTLCPKKEQD